MSQIGLGDFELAIGSHEWEARDLTGEHHRFFPRIEDRA